LESSGSFSTSLSNEHFIFSFFEAGACSSQLLILFLRSLEIEVLPFDFSLIYGLFSDKLILNALQGSFRYRILGLVFNLLIDSKAHLLGATLMLISFMEAHLNIFLMQFQPFIIFVQFVEILQIIA